MTKRRCIFTFFATLVIVGAASWFIAGNIGNAIKISGRKEIQARMSENCSEEEFIHEVLKRYNRSRNITEDPAFDSQIDKSLKTAVGSSSPFHYVATGSLFMARGDFDSAVNAFNNAVNVNPKIDMPHIFLAFIYYKLALFDMFDRGLCEIDLVPINDITQYELKRGHIGIEIKEMLSTGRPNSYEETLSAKGFDQEKRFGIQAYVMMNTLHKGLFPATEETKTELKHIMDLFGMPRELPVPRYKPDMQAQRILKIAKNELDIAEQGTPMNTPPGIVMFQQDILEAFTERIYSLLGYEGERKTYENKKVYSLKSEETAAILAHWSRKSEAFVKKGQYEKALECLDKGLLIQPDNPDLNAGKSVVLFGLDRYEEAFEYSKKAVEEDPHCAPAVIAYGTCRLAVNGFTLPAKDKKAVVDFLKNDVESTEYKIRMGAFINLVMMERQNEYAKLVLTELKRQKPNLLEEFKELNFGR